MTFYLLIAAIDLVVGLLALTKRGDKAANALALFCLGACAWSIELFLLTYLEDVRVLDFWFHTTRLGMFLIPPFMALLVLRLVGAQSTLFRRCIVYPGFALAVAQFALNMTILPSTLRPAEGGHLPVPDMVYYSFVFNFALCFLSSIAFAAIAHRSAASRDKQRIKWLLIIVIVTFLFGGMSAYFMTFDFYLSKFIGGTTNAAFMLLLLYATVQHHLVDIRLAMTMAASRLALLAGFAGVYLVLKALIPDSPGDAGTLVAFGVMAVLALEFYPRALMWLEPMAKRLLMASHYDYPQAVATAGVQLKRSTDYNDLTHLLDHLFYQVIGVDTYEVYLVVADSPQVKAVAMRDTCQQLDMHHQDLLLEPHLLRSSVIMVDEIQTALRAQLSARSAASFLPIRRDGQLQALVLVGKSAIQSYYRYDDVRLMEWLAGELSQALYRISTYERLDSELAEAKKRLSMLGVMNLYHHDIKAPLSIIDGVVSNDLYDDAKRRSIILEQVAWGTRLIATMAQLLKADRKRQTGPVVLQEVLDDCCFVFARSVRQLSVEHDGAFLVQADADDLKILFINVIKNAVEAFSADRLPELKVKSWATDQGVYTSISDNGIGMTEQQLDCLWLRHGSSKPGGNGIGLQAIKKIADEHSARITVSSVSGRGTTFTFEFPHPEQDSAAQAMPQSSIA